MFFYATGCTLSGLLTNYLVCHAFQRSITPYYSFIFWNVVAWIFVLKFAFSLFQRWFNSWQQQRLGEMWRISHLEMLSWWKMFMKCTLSSPRVGSPLVRFTQKTFVAKLWSLSRIIRNRNFLLLYLKGGFPSWCHYRTVCINNSTHSMGMLRYSTIWAISPLLSPSIQPEPQSGLLPKLAPASSLSLSSFFFCWHLLKPFREIPL